MSTIRPPDNSKNNPGITEGNSASGLKVLYMLVLFGSIAYSIYLFLIKFNELSETYLVMQAVYLAPAWWFAAVGLISIKNKRSLAYAIAAAVIAFFAIRFFFGFAWGYL